MGAGDGVQDKLSPNMAPWPKDGLKLEESEKMAEAGRSLRSPPLSFLPEAGDKCPKRNHPLPARENRDCPGNWRRTQSQGD